MKTRDPGIISPHTNCRCGSPGSLTLLEVIHIPSGRARIGAFSQFGSITARSNRLVLQDNYRFKRWVVECTTCRHNDDQKEMFG